MTTPDLLRLLPPDAGLVVEIGPGTLEEPYRRINPHGKFMTIALPAEAEIEEGSVDCLVYENVLEQVPAPWAILKRQAAWLRPGGLVLACLSNVQHWSRIMHLLRGQWPYQDEGLLDRKHLRFFTLESIGQLFTQAGLTVWDVHTRDRKGAEFPKFQELLAPVLRGLGLEAGRFALQTGAYQYVVRACKPPFPARRLSLQTLVHEHLVCARPRVWEPDRFLNTVPGVRATSAIKKMQLPAALEGQEQVFIWQRAYLRYPEDLAVQKTLLRQGYLIVAEIDDDPLRWSAPEANGLFSYRSCHAVQTSTEPLAEVLRQYNPNVVVFANQLAYLPPPRTYPADQPVTLFFGALNREDDWRLILPALSRVLADFRGRARFQVIHDQRFFDALETEAKSFEPFCRYERYEEILRGCDIALLPLLPTRFNGMKSDLKFLECAGHGVAALASPTVYENTIVDGETGFLYRSEEEFEDRLRRLIADQELRRRLTANAYRWVGEKRLLSRHYRRRLDWYLQMRDELPRLNEELRGRVPELFDSRDADS